MPGNVFPLSLMVVESGVSARTLRNGMYAGSNIVDAALATRRALLDLVVLLKGKQSRLLTTRVLCVLVVCA